MDSDAPQGQIAAWIDDHRDACIGFLQDLVAIPSASTVGEEEAAVVARVREEMEALEYDEVFVDGIGNVHGVVQGTGNGDAVMLNSHLDTVGVGDSGQWDRDPYAAEIEEGYLYGLGASDMKCAMAAMVYGGAAVANTAATPERDLYVTGEVMEEIHEGHAMRYVDQELGLDLSTVVIGEATELDVKRGHRGRCELAVKLTGQSCHASAPDRGVNPLYHAVAIVDRIRELNDETADHDVLGRGTIAATNVEVETPSNNAIPAGATVYVDRRLTVGEDENTVHAELQDAIAAAEEAYGDEVDARVETLTFDRASYTGHRNETPKYYPTWFLDADHEVVQRTKTIVDDTLGRDAAVRKWTFSTSGTYTMGAAGIPTIGFGPSREEEAHVANEKVAVEDVVEAIPVYARLGLEL